MAIAAAIILPIGLLFLLSGLIINFIQALLFILVRPFSKNIFRRINKEVAELLWLEIVWLFDWWANVKVELYTDQETYGIMGKEPALIISNHRSDIDWLVGWVLAQRVGCLGNTIALAKKSLSYLPVLGWSMWFSCCISLERSWNKDENILKSGFQELNDFHQPFWLAVFVEGTRFTHTKLLAAQEYAVSVGKPIPRNVLIPRTKGFVASVSHLRSIIPAIYDITLAIPKDKPRPTLLRMLRGCSSVDALLDRHLATGTFGDQECQDIGRPKKSLMVVICWSCFLFFSAIKFFEWCPFSWGGVVFCAVFLVLVLVLMQILIVSSKSEKSTAPKVPPPNTLKENLLPA
ncbi:1-acyl-sn-glycerol-3-phosphate acyltransferase PLS1-like isoform X2 [Solanum verrucosum]|uniref:1-acyl-sn-glycerol-3-phosphate acyltransferase PLS1-like isoform X2 n=1 Tax=Solanum verrucosum TaxID=315347 RepID=UPI0020CFF48C|nr:1-acyl-sn-glycerol-3-phosphate acyltransferase PLS1-like isoform X2 [Solanum verrucosum]XP_049379260.1 1-acyl-sn-glycerol-3-phosphate acyltransferase PLS1-like isoform X3 [Solanum stenotomum]